MRCWRCQRLRTSACSMETTRVLPEWGNVKAACACGGSSEALVLSQSQELCLRSTCSAAHAAVRCHVPSPASCIDSRHPAKTLGSHPAISTHRDVYVASARSQEQSLSEAHRRAARCRAPGPAGAGPTRRGEMGITAHAFRSVNCHCSEVTDAAGLAAKIPRQKTLAGSDPCMSQARRGVSGTAARRVRRMRGCDGSCSGAPIAHLSC